MYLTPFLSFEIALKTKPARGVDRVGSYFGLFTSHVDPMIMSLMDPESRSCNARLRPPLAVVLLNAKKLSTSVGVLPVRIKIIIVILVNIHITIEINTRWIQTIFKKFQTKGMDLGGLSRGVAASIQKTTQQRKKTFSTHGKP